MPSTRRLSPRETRARLASLGIARRRGGAFAFEDDADRIGYDFHAHRQHQLLYAMSGVARLQTRTSEFLLPPQRAAWIPARTPHATDLNGAKVLSIYFERASLPGGDVRVFDVPALVREMLLYARRWPLDRAQPRAAEASTFFRALLVVLADAVKHRSVYALPRARSELTARAMEWVLAHLTEATLVRAARHAGTSARTLRRHFSAETGVPFRAFVNQARVQRAVELLSGTSMSIVEVAFEVGFQSQSAFTQAFRRRTGVTPRGFRLRAA
ncbi:MAG TPA: helix-turn-helix transcriptional regulator [Polyangiaceae bacterium]|nr:helix-turn-helix transcriptional regulator [Polyangiaceae bacterium]